MSIAIWPTSTTKDWTSAVEAAITATGGYVSWSVVARSWGIDPTTGLLWLPKGLPACQFEDKKVLDIVRKINDLLGVDDDQAGVADWWFLPSIWLGHQSPASLLNTGNDEQLLSAARAAIE
jgi:hypothetical protein